MPATFVLEVCAFNIRSCLIATEAGAMRIELCADPLQGGTTPSYGTIKEAIEKTNIPIFPMIRPRGGNFIFDEDELAAMKIDIAICKELGCGGIATGVQLPNGSIDTELMKRIVEWAYPMKVTCHKVFDLAPDPFAALEELIAAGCTRVLTSGQKANAVEGISTLAALRTAANGRIIVMPGGGVRSGNIERLIKETGCEEFHTSALPKNAAAQSNTLLNTGNMYLADAEEIKTTLRNGRPAIS